MEMREIIAFYHVARFRSISKAAEYMNVGQPAVTTRLKKIEKEFGVLLFDRVKRPIQLTSDGVTFYELARPLVEGLDALKAQMDHPEQAGSFTVGAYPDLALYYLPQVVKEFSALYPGVQIKLLARSYLPLIDMVLDGELALALAHKPAPDNASLDFKELFRSSPVLIAPLGHELVSLAADSSSEAITIADIARWPLVALGPEGYTRRTMEQALRRAGVRYNIALEMTTMEMVKRYVEIGMGVSMVYEFDIQPGDESRLGMVKLPHLFPESQVGIITVKGKVLGRAVHNFIDCVIEGLVTQRKRSLVLGD
jgi:DNA-binding transcriptional LysR family regulator